MTRAAKEYPNRTKLLACACLTTVQILASTILKLSNHNGTYSFSPQSSLVISESIKCVVSFAYLVSDSRNPHTARRALVDQSSRALTLHMAALAAIYCVNNGMMFWLFARADPGSITLVKSGATVVSAVMMYFTRRFKLSLIRWAVIVIQMLGLVVAQYDSCAGKSHLGRFVYGVLMLSLFNSSMANVWNEHVIKSFEGASLATKNIYLYLFGAIFNMGIFLRSKTDSPGFFEGYGLAGIGVVITNAFMGIAINVVYKYADAVVKNMATTSTTVVLLIVSGFFFGGRQDVMVFIGGGVVVLGTFLYFGIGVSEKGWVKAEAKAGSGST